MALWTQADVDALKAAVSSGVLQVRFEGPPARLVSYQSLAEMRALLSSMVRDVAAASGQASGYALVAYRKGM